MSWVATAIIGSAVIGGAASNRASQRAAEGQSKALAASKKGTGLAEINVRQLFGEAGQARGRGFGETLDFISGASSRQIQPFQAGNVAAQEQVSRGLPQVLAAIRGTPVDLSGFEPRSIGTPESFNFDLSRFRPGATPPIDLSTIAPNRDVPGRKSLFRRPL